MHEKGDIRREILADFRLESETLDAFKTSGVVGRVMHGIGLSVSRRVKTGHWELHPHLGAFIRERTWDGMRKLIESGEGDVLLIHAGRFGDRMREHLVAPQVIWGGHPHTMKQPREGELKEALRKLAEDVVVWLEMNGERVDNGCYSLSISHADVLGRRV